MVDVFAHFLIVQLRIFSVNMVGALHNLFVNSPCGISRPVAHEPCRRHAADIRASFHQKGFRSFPRSADGGSPAGRPCPQNQYVHRVIYRRLPLHLQHSVFFHSHFSSTFRFSVLCFPASGSIFICLYCTSSLVKYLLIPVQNLNNRAQF